MAEDKASDLICGIVRGEVGASAPASLIRKSLLRLLRSDFWFRGELRDDNLSGRSTGGFTILGTAFIPRHK